MKKASAALLAASSMRTNVALAALIALGAGVVGVGASDHVPNLTLRVLSQCTALHTLGDPISFYGRGSSSEESALEVTGSGSTRLIAPMSRPLGTGISSVPASRRVGAEGMVVALDAVSIAIDSSTVGAEGIDYPGTAGNTSNHWRTGLRELYAGTADGAGSNVFARDRNSAARQAFVNNWDDVFHGRNNALVEPRIRRAFRRDDAAGNFT